MKKSEIKLIVLDVDGVLTDGNLLIGSNGVEFKSFHVKDGMGISLVRFYGIKVAIITGRKSESVQIRSRELNIDFLYEGIANKEEILYEIITLLEIDLKNVCYIGDDINDLPVIKLVGYSAAPQDAVEIVRKSVDYICKYNGGNGAVREVIDLILAEQADYDVLVENYLSEKIKITQ
ncbi:KdsC family phosphatase [Neobacillus vireti]|uniref:3-deoxy-D-manno-octulosonate 8-phosphate n=1 Tax=Neobacillus vireti LMG 21834 TaxID=1131730 RepID=A0AB94IKH8_9BACI|nr:HAD hydrolase family protein [Neobacillus vireti]ETI67539.1 3-deoxy-D-manno-octulosonate 8-phosphate [Neobacillus vireti LMG 21834]KLT18507.1 3-deoxy-D-manno-octulosonate 8-phosphate phosphatase [Neobacillus vireti]